MSETAAMPSDPVGALADLRRARSRKRLADIHWIDAVYQVYISAIVGGAIVLLVSSVIGDGRLDPAGVQRVLDDGPALLGVVIALALAVGLRSGSRGGPLAVEAPDVRHVLLAPIRRELVMRGPALRQLRFVMFVCVVVGVIAGQLAVRRLGGSPVAWVACGAAVAVATGALTMGLAFVASGRRLPSWVSTVVGGLLIVWAVGDVAGAFPTSPTAILGRMAVWPLHFDALAIVPAVIGLVAVAIGVLGLGGISLEAAERRTALVGQLRFAVTLQDLRTVLVLRRQLAMELPRQDPWIRQHSPGHFPSWHRGVRGVLRWPLARVGRLVGVGIIAGLALRAVWDGTTPLLVVSGLAMFVAGLDAIEPLAQETDHPGRRDAVPRTVGDLMVRHLPLVAAVMVFVGLVAAAAALAVDPSRQALVMAAICLLPVSLAGGAGAVVSVVMGAPEHSDTWQLVPPEVAGMRNAFRAGWPPLLAMLGGLPLVAAHKALDNGSNPYGVAANVSVLILLVVALVAMWVHQREQIKAWWRTMSQMQTSGATATSGAGGRKAESPQPRTSGRVTQASVSGGAGARAARQSGGTGARSGAKPAPKKVKTRLERR